MNSFNHYAYGAIGDWMYRVVAGIEIGEPGYKHILIQPHPDKKFTYAKSSFESSYGQIAAGWEMKDGKLLIKVKVPANTTATIILPEAQAGKVTEGGIPVNTAFKNVKQDKNNLVIEAGSGDYSFEYVPGGN